MILDDLSFRAGANLLPALVYIISAKGEIEFVNESFTRFTGWSLADLSGGSFVHLIHPGDLEPTMTALRRALSAVRATIRRSYAFCAQTARFGHFTVTR